MHKSKKGVLKYILCILIIILMILFLADGIKQPEIIGYKDVLIQNGDTLWSVCANNSENFNDIRTCIYDTKEINNIGSIIYPGQVLKIPIYD